MTRHTTGLSLGDWPIAQCHIGHQPNSVDATGGCASSPFSPVLTSRGGENELRTELIDQLPLVLDQAALTAPTSRGACAGSLIGVTAARPALPQASCRTEPFPVERAASTVQSWSEAPTLPRPLPQRPPCVTNETTHATNRRSERSLWLRSLLLPQVHAPGSPAARTHSLTKQRQWFVRHQRERPLELRIDAGEFAQRRLDLRRRQLGARRTGFE